MNVKAGDRARVVNTHTPNDGAVVDVIELDEEWSKAHGKPVWFVKGRKMLAFADARPIPTEVLDEGVMPDANLRRVENDADGVDKRTRIDIEDPHESLADAVRKATETLCPTT